MEEQMSVLFKTALRALLEQFDILFTEMSSKSMGSGCDWIRTTIDIRPKEGTWEQTLGAIIPLVRDNDETPAEDDIATKLVRNICLREEKKLNELYSHEHPDHQEKDECRFQEGIVAGANMALCALETLKKEGAHQSVEDHSGSDPSGEAPCHHR